MHASAVYERGLRTRVMNELDRKRFTVGAAPYLATALTAFRVNPGDSVDYQQRGDVVAHGAASFNDSSFAARPPVFSVCCHR